MRNFKYSKTRGSSFLLVDDLENNVITTVTGGLNRSDIVYRIISGGGQSNIQGHTTATYTDADKAVADIYQWGSSGDYAGELDLAKEPLSHITQMTNLIGCMLGFAKSYLPSLKANERLILIPAAMGGTGFSDNRWNPGDDLFTNLVERTNTVLSTFPNAKLDAILWHQGEKDAQNAYGKAAHSAALDSMVLNFRGSILGAQYVPFIAGEMIYSWVGTDADKVAIQESIQELPSRLDNCYVVNTSTLTAQVDGIHFDEISMRALGVLYKDALLAAVTTKASNIVAVPTPFVHLKYESGTVVTEESGKTITLFNTVNSYVENDYFSDYVVDANGTDSEIRIDAALPQTYTKCAWVKTNSGSTPNQNIISSDAATSHVFWISGETLQLAAGHSGNLTEIQDDSEIVENEWYHIAVTFDNTSRVAKMYKNGFLIKTVTFGGTLGATSSPIRVLAYQAEANCWNGQQYEQLVFDSVLTDEQVKAIAERRSSLHV